MIRVLGYIAYHVGLFLYAFMVRLASLWNTKAKLFVNGRKGLLYNITQQTATDTREKIWFHCASLGEFEQARPVMERLKREYPSYAIVVTFFSPSGYEIRKNYSGADYVFYLPLDTAENALLFVSALKLKCAFFVKYEIWYHYLKTLNQFHIPAFLLSANIRQDHIYLKGYGRFFTDMLRSFQHIFSQNAQSNQLLLNKGFTEVSVSKDTRFDRVFENSKQVKELPLIQRFTEGKKVLIIGSSYKQEEAIVKSCLEYLTDWKVIIAPHHIDSGRVSEIVSFFDSVGVTTYSELNNDSSLISNTVLVIDNIGMLSAIYQYGTVAFIGGGFGKNGLHNTLEAAVFGMPVLFGPNNLKKFPESLDMIDAGVGFIIQDESTLAAYLKEWNEQSDKLIDIGTQAKQFIASQTGATQHIFEYLQKTKVL